MKKYLNFYLDESGGNNSEFFTVGGFYIYSNNSIEFINKTNMKICSNILKTEKSIKQFRKNEEPDLEQYIINENNHKEVKWNTLTYKNKYFLFNNLKQFTQKHVSITSNLKKWKSNANRKPNLEAIYNIMVLYLLERTLNSLNINVLDELELNVYIDQRKIVPNIKNTEQRLESLEGYIKTTWFMNNQFVNSNIKIIQLDSVNKPLIRYADYYVGLINSMCRFYNNSTLEWDIDINILFENFHKKSICKCYSTIKEQCNVLEKVCSQCAVYYLVEH